MKKGLLKFGLVLAIIVGVVSTVNAIDLFAASEKGAIIVSDGVVTEAGGSTSITYSFKVNQGTVDCLQAHFTWDSSLMTYDHDEMVNLKKYGKPADGNLSVYMDETGTTDACTITIYFKNVLPSGVNGDSVPINVTFEDATTGFVEFGSKADGTPPQGYYALSEILMPTAAQSSVRLVEPEVTISIDPTSATVEKGETQQFTATVVNDNSGATFKVDGGTDSKIDENGLLTVGANETAKELTVIATSKKDATKTVTAKVTVKEPAKPVLSLDLKGDKTSVLIGVASEVQFTATPSVSEGTQITYVVSGNKSKDTTISEKGLLTISADESATALTVTATATNKTTDPESISASATVNLVDKLPVEIGLDITNVEVEQGGKKVLTAIVLNDDGAGVTWEVIGAKSKDTKITPNTLARALSEKAELFVGADEEVGTKLTVKVTSKLDPTKSATAIVTVKEKGKVSTPAPSQTKPTAKPSTAPTSSGGVKTGDTTNTGLLVAMMGFSLLTLGSVVMKRKYSK